MSSFFHAENFGCFFSYGLGCFFDFSLLLGACFESLRLAEGAKWKAMVVSHNENASWSFEVFVRFFSEDFVVKKTP